MIDSDNQDSLGQALDAEAKRLREELCLDAVQIIVSYTLHPSELEDAERMMSAGAGSVLRRRALCDWVLTRWRHQDKDDDNYDVRDD
jgi:hypothetical protein